MAELAPAVLDHHTQPEAGAAAPTDKGKEPPASSWTDAFVREAYSRKDEILEAGLVIAAVGVAIATRGRIGLKTELKAAEAAETLEFPSIPALERAVEAPRVYPHPDRIVTQREMTITADVRNLYERSFPIEERQPTEDVQALIDTGRIRLDTTRDLDGRVHSFSFVSIHDEGPMPFAHLDFIAAEQSVRSQGLGSEHFLRLTQTLQKENPNFVGMSLEMEDPAAPGLTMEEKSARQFRSKFYERLGAKNELPGYINGQGQYVAPYQIVDFDRIEEAGYKAEDQPAEWRVSWFNKAGAEPLTAMQKANAAARMSTTFFQDEGGYGMAADHDAVVALKARLNNRPISDLEQLK